MSSRGPITPDTENEISEQRPLQLYANLILWLRKVRGRRAPDPRAESKPVALIMVWVTGRKSTAVALGMSPHTARRPRCAGVGKIRLGPLHSHIPPKTRSVGGENRAVQ